MKWAVLHIETAFQLNITLDHSVIETRGRAHLTQTTNQHLRIIVKLSSHAHSNHLEHLSNTSHRLPLKEIKGISQDRSVIETWGWARLTRAASSQSWITSTHTGHALATIVDHLSNQNSQTHSSESGFRRNVKFATFEEADGLCKNIPHNGVKLAPLGGRASQSCPHDLKPLFNWT